MCHSNQQAVYRVTVTDVTVNESDSIVCARGRVGVLSFNFRMSDSNLLPTNYPLPNYSCQGETIQYVIS